MAKKQKSAAPPPPVAETSSDEPTSPKHPRQQENDLPESETSSEQQPPSQNPKPTASSSSDSGSDSDTPKPKPLAWKPIDQTPKPKDKSSSALKRPAKSIDMKRAKKKNKGTDDGDGDEGEDDANKGAGGGDSRKLFQRLWSEEDEVAILKGMVEFNSKTGNDPYKYADAFYDFVKRSLHAEASSHQLKEKIRRLKKKFENNAQRGKDGEDPNFSKPFDREAFELSKKVWGNAGDSNGAVVKVVKADRKVAKSPKKEVRMTNVAPSKQKSDLKSEARSVDSNKDEKMDIDRWIDATSCLVEAIRVNKGVGLYGLNEDVIKRGMELIGESEKKELEGQWKEQQAAEFELSVRRVELVANHARLILEAYKSSNQ